MNELFEIRRMGKQGCSVTFPEKEMAGLAFGIALDIALEHYKPAEICVLDFFVIMPNVVEGDVLRAKGVIAWKPREPAVKHKLTTLCTTN
jgi:hypothetical protein